MPIIRRLSAAIAESRDDLGPYFGANSIACREKDADHASFVVRDAKALPTRSQARLAQWSAILAWHRSGTGC